MPVSPWIWLGVLGLLGAALTLVLHELSHCIVVWLSGGWIEEFKPWPHMKDGKFYFGRMSHSGAQADERAFTVAPLIKALSLLALWTVLGFIWLPLWALAFWEFTDVANWTQGYIRNSPNDGGRFRRAGGPTRS